MTVDRTDYGLEEPPDPAGEVDEETADDSPEVQWWACADCGRRERGVRQWLDQDVALCPECFADREGLA